MRTRHIKHILSVCLPVSEGKHGPLFAPTDVHKTSCNIQQLFVQWAIDNLSFYLPFQIASSGYQTLCYVRLPVSGIGNSLPYSLVNRQADCGTAGQSTDTSCCTVQIHIQSADLVLFRYTAGIFSVLL